MNSVRGRARYRAWLGWCLIRIEIAATLRAFLIHLSALAVLVMTGPATYFGILGGMVVESFLPDGDSTEKVVAVSPDGRIRAVRTDDTGRGPTYGLRIRVTAGLDRSTWILDGCSGRPGTIMHVRFLDNRTLEYTLPQRSPVRVHFDRNVKTERRACP